MKSIKIFAAVLVAALAFSCKSQDVKVEGVELPTSADVDSVSYLIGVNFGSFLKGNGFCEELSELNMAQIKKGMKDFLKAEGSPYDPAFGEQFDIDLNKMGEILNGFISKKQEYKSEYNRQAGKNFLSKNIKKETVDSTASGLQYTIIAEGAAEKIQPKDTVWVFYRGTTIDGKEFDGNMDAEEPTRFVANQVIKGWTEGLGLVGEGGEINLFIPSDMAYGPRGSRGIEPNSVLIFEVKVHKVGKFVPEEDNEEDAAKVKTSPMHPGPQIKK